MVADVNSPNEDLRDAVWYQPGIPRSVIHSYSTPLTIPTGTGLLCVATDGEEKL